MKTRFLTVSILALVTATPAMAQGLEEIVVTAQRREQNLQDIPVSVSAFSGDAIASGNIKSAVDYLAQTPNVSFTEDGQSGSRGMGISVRGVNNLVTGENAFINSVGMYLDEFSIASVPQAVANPFLPDMERIEVLRGPQGTLFGRNSLGGALNLITKAPTDEMGAKIIVGGEDYENAGSQYNVTLIGNAPLTDTFRTRAVLYWEDSSGLVENVTPAGNDSGHEFFDARVKAVWDVTPDTSVTGTLIYSNQDQGSDENVPSGVWDLDTIDTFGVGAPGALPSPINPRDENGNPIGFWPDNQNKLSHDVDEHNKLESIIGIINVQHQLNDSMRLKWITGIISADQDRLFDNDLVGNLDLIYRDNGYEGSSWSTELRLEVTGNRMDWVVGAMYAQDDQEQDNNVAINTSPTALWDVDGNPATAGDQFGFLPPFPQDLGLALNHKNFEVKQMAVFGDITFHLSDNLDIIAGGRFTHDDVTNEIQSFGIAPSCDFTDLACFDPATGPGPLFFPSFVNYARPPSSADEDFTDFAPRFAGHLKVTDEVAIYAVLSKGYKAGGVAVGNNTNAGDAAFSVPFDKETLWNYELGFKTELFDNRVRWNTSLFHLEWSDLQLEAFRFLTPGDLSSNFEQVVSVESADATGIETEFVWAPTDQLTFMGTLGYLHTEITSPSTAQLTGGVNVDLQGLSVPKSPEFSASLSGEYRWPMMAGEGWVRLEFVHRDGQYSDVEALTWKQHHNGTTVTQIGVVVPEAINGFPYKTPDYDLLHIRAGFDWQSWAFSFYVQNLTDEEYYTGTQENFGLSGIRLKPHPRFFGGSVSYSFGGI